MHPRGQTLVEAALVLPLFIMVLFGIVVLGIGIFYQQQVTNVAREAARYAAIHSATALRPTVGNLDPDDEDPPGSLQYGTYASQLPDTYVRWDTPANQWADTTAHARGYLFGIPRSSVHISLCWSGYRNATAPGVFTGAFDAPAPGTYTIGGSDITFTTGFVQCQIDGQDPLANPGAIRCQAGLTTKDEASSMSEANPHRYVANTVTAFACYEWRPPAAGFLVLPQVITLRAVITEPIQRQQ
jgi:hypothetical protein